MADDDDFPPEVEKAVRLLLVVSNTVQFFMLHFLQKLAKSNTA